MLELGKQVEPDEPFEFAPPGSEIDAGASSEPVR
jgi:hypothetical protein